ncbi:hypothetical protein CLV94_0663 [Flavobacterium endophyticum]|uniref:Uncharacterized protein n=1 Tax=Flavobacterium endophyticum TaxID=1540163 RepID=A0A495MJT8_9FLAO|nr:hypothetical protein [Flavobacterium endophyticum]RKS25625.1 hypothetical protein CLV94_0663 [Flavobacterium endophyticum]
MFAEDILALDFDNSSVRKKLEVYNYGLNTARKGEVINFNQLKKVLDKIAHDKEENDDLQVEFIRGFSDSYE